MMIPQDPNILYSYINTMLRDKYHSLKELCDDNGIEEKDIVLKLQAAGFEYDESANQFRYQKPPAISKGPGENGSKTIDYYNRNASFYATDTFLADCSEIQEKFMSKLFPGAKVLDFGCGSGRDAAVFLKHGFDVTATDGSEELCRIASENTGLKVVHLYFRHIDYREEFDGIWACASILHLSYDELSVVLPKMVTALKPEGILYASFKYGDFEGVRNGRYFCDFTEKRFAGLINGISGIALEEQWISRDVRPGRNGEKWLNIILRKNELTD